MQNTLLKGIHIIENGTKIEKELFPYSGENNHCSKLKEFEVRQIRYWYSYGLSTKQELANYFHVSVSTIRDIINYRTWKHLSTYRPNGEIITATKFQLVNNSKSNNPKLIALVHMIVSPNETKLLEIIHDDELLLNYKYPDAVLIGEYIIET